VEVARASFERIVALREGLCVFDLPSSDVTDTMLHALYADHEDELAVHWPSAAGLPDAVASDGLERPMTCR
jgi:ABC-type phosphate/phosphonate transport system ATPase subunit